MLKTNQRQYQHYAIPQEIVWSSTPIGPNQKWVVTKDTESLASKPNKERLSPRQQLLQCKSNSCKRNKLAKLGDATAISKSETMNHWRTWHCRSCKSAFGKYTLHIWVAFRLSLCSQNIAIWQEALTNLKFQHLMIEYQKCRFLSSSLLKCQLSAHWKFPKHNFLNEERYEVTLCKSFCNLDWNFSI